MSRPVMWTCEMCSEEVCDLETAWHRGWIKLGTCDECARQPEEDREAEDDAFDPHEATYRLELAFSDIFSEWPRDVPLDELVEWLRVKHGMMKVEAARWPGKGGAS